MNRNLRYQLKQKMSSGLRQLDVFLREKEKQLLIEKNLERTCQRQEEKRDKKEQAALKDFNIREKPFLDEKKRLLKNILTWGNLLSKTMRWREIGKFVLLCWTPVFGSCEHQETTVNSHGEPYYIGKAPTWHHRGEIGFRRNGLLLPRNYLAKLWTHIHTGEVYETIKKQVAKSDEQWNCDKCCEFCKEDSWTGPWSEAEGYCACYDHQQEIRREGFKVLRRKHKHSR